MGMVNVDQIAMLRDPYHTIFSHKGKPDMIGITTDNCIMDIVKGWYSSFSSRELNSHAFWTTFFITNRVLELSDDYNK